MLTSGRLRDSADVDFAGLVDLLLEESRFKSKRVFEFITLPVNVIVRRDIDMLGIAIQNVLENSDQHASPGSPVKVMLDERGMLILQNDSPAIPEDGLNALRARLVRMSLSKSGSGFGLSIVDEIMNQSGGKVNFRSPCFENARRFQVTLIFKKSPADQFKKVASMKTIGKVS